MGSMAQQQSSPPYAPTTAGVGGRPTITTDIPILAVLLLFYVAGAVGLMTILQLNQRKGHKFLMSGALFGFCMARNTTCVLRLVWATRIANVRIAIASSIFTAAGVLLVYIILMLLCLRVFRATQPQLGWTRTLAITVKALYFLVFISIVLVISFTILSFYTLDTSLRQKCLWVQRAGVLYFLLFNLVSITLLLLSIFLPRRGPVENFGTGSIRSKQIILGVALFFATFIAGFRMGTSWASTREADNPAWFDSKAAFYVIEFAFEIVIIFLLLVSRFDQRFWVPNGSNKPGDFHQLGEEVPETKRSSNET